MQTHYLHLSENNYFNNGNHLARLLLWFFTLSPRIFLPPPRGGASTLFQPERGGYFVGNGFSIPFNLAAASQHDDGERKIIYNLIALVNYAYFIIQVGTALVLVGEVFSTQPREPPRKRLSDAVSGWPRPFVLVPGMANESSLVSIIYLLFERGDTAKKNWAIPECNRRHKLRWKRS